MIFYYNERAKEVRVCTREDGIDIITIRSFKLLLKIPRHVF